MTITTQTFGLTQKGEKVTQYTLENDAAVRVCLLDYGANISAIYAPDKQGVLADICLGYDDLSGYESSGTYFGAVVGRFANRIANGQFSLAGHTYQLACNNGVNHLHGGLEGFDKRLWQAQQVSDSAIAFTLISEEGDQGYPGCLSLTVTYELMASGTLSVRYYATTDALTILNVTQHAYFNLSGCLDQPVTDHIVNIQADYITAVDRTLIPTGELMPVAGTPFDFRQPTKIADALAMQHPQLEIGGGFDHNFVLHGEPETLRQIAKIAHPESGRCLIVETDQPGVQFYSGNFIDGSETGKQGVIYQKRSGFCLETQHFPDSPNQPQFPSVELTPDKPFQSETRFNFQLFDGF